MEYEKSVADGVHRDDVIDNTPVSITPVEMILLCSSAIEKHFEALRDMEYDECGPLTPEPDKLGSSREAVIEYLVRRWKEKKDEQRDR